MKYVILAWFKKAIAVLLSFFTAAFSCGSVPGDISRGEVGKVSAYDSSAADYSLNIDAGSRKHDISDLLFGIFLEDINFAVDGGMYAEKVANRSFEFTSLARDDAKVAWSAVGGAGFEVVAGDEENMLNVNNPSYAVITNGSDVPAGIQNRGFLAGMSAEKDAQYDFSVYAKSDDAVALTVQLCVGDEVAAEGVIPALTGEWKKYELSLTSSMASANGAVLRVLAGAGTVCLDMVSLFPHDTYKGRANGIRRDIGEALEALDAKFLRFPGGCAVEGVDDATAYSWKASVGAGPDREPLLFDGRYGDVAARKQGIDLWTDLGATDDPYPSFMSYGMGFYEYFLLCEDLGVAPVPVLSAALYCQMRGKSGPDVGSERFEEYVDDMLDLVEFCRGGGDTVWGRVRCSLGHPEPFDLPYIAVGNENEGDIYYEHYTVFMERFNEAKKADPEMFDGIELIYSAGPSDATHGENYIKSYEYAEKYLADHPEMSVRDFAGATDQHYYNDPEWFLQNTDYYDEGVYGRELKDITTTRYGGAIPVFLGEYAARSNTLKAALAEAAYMTGLERNGDIVAMAAYAPLFGNTTAVHWSPDLIWYDNTQVAGSVNYYVQQLFMQNQGKTLLDSSLDGAAVPQKDISGKIGVGTWNTSAAFDNVKVTDNGSGKTLACDNFTVPGYFMKWTTPTDGKWRTEKGRLVQKNTGMEYSETGSVAYMGDADWTDYTYTLDAEKIAGNEGFMISFGVKDTKDCIIWDNTVSCLQIIENGVKTGRIPGTVRPFEAEEGRVYHLKITVSGRNVKCWIDDELYVDFNVGSSSEAEAYQVVSEGADGSVIIKLVNVTGSERAFAVEIGGGQIAPSGTVSVLAGAALTDENRVGDEKIVPETSEVDGFSNQFNYTVPKYSVTVIKLQKG